VALAGIAFGMYTSLSPTAGGVNLLFAFETVVIGGIGSLWGTLIGGILLGIAQQFGAHFNEQYTVLAGNVLFLLVLAIRLRVSSARRWSCRERRRPHPVDQSITVKRHQIPVAYTLAGAIVLVVFFTWAPWILPASDVSILMNFFILVIMATMWNLLAGTPGWSRSVSRPSSVSALTPPLLRHQGNGPLRRNSARGDHLRRHRVPGDVSTFSPPRGYFSVATWVVADSAMLVIGSIAFFGGGTGHYLPGLSSIAFTQLNHDTYLAAWFVALIVVVATYILLRSRLGLVLSSSATTKWPRAVPVRR